MELSHKDCLRKDATPYEVELNKRYKAFEEKLLELPNHPEVMKENKVLWAYHCNLYELSMDVKELAKPPKKSPEVMQVKKKLVLPPNCS